MSMISKQVKELRETAEMFDQIDDGRRMLLQAADTIESLLARLATLNGGEWIACEDRMPEDMEDVLVFYKANIDGGTHDGEEIYNFGIGYYFSHNKKWSVVTLIKPKGNTLKITAWQPLPEPYHP